MSHFIILGEYLLDGTCKIYKLLFQIFPSNMERKITNAIFES